MNKPTEYDIQRLLIRYVEETNGIKYPLDINDPKIIEAHTLFLKEISGGIPDHMGPFAAFVIKERDKEWNKALMTDLNKTMEFVWRTENEERIKDQRIIR